MGGETRPARESQQTSDGTNKAGWSSAQAHRSEATVTERTVGEEEPPPHSRSELGGRPRYARRDMQRSQKQSRQDRRKLESPPQEGGVR